MRFWGRLLAAAFGMAALVGAAQFGVVYGLDVLRLDREFTAGADNDWNLQLTWVVWFTIVAVAGGATFAAGLALRDRRRIGAAVRIVDRPGRGAGRGRGRVPADAATGAVRQTQRDLRPGADRRHRGGRRGRRGPVRRPAGGGPHPAGRQPVDLHRRGVAAGDPVLPGHHRVRPQPRRDGRVLRPDAAGRARHQRPAADPPGVVLDARDRPAGGADLRPDRPARRAGRGC